MKTFMLFLTAGVIAGTATLAQAATTAGDTADCVPFSAIKERLVIDDKTVVLRGYGKQSFRRMDMAERCTGLEPWGKSFKLLAPRRSINAVCAHDDLRVAGEVGFCTIGNIVGIDDAEAKALLKRR